MSDTHVTPSDQFPERRRRPRFALCLLVVLAACVSGPQFGYLGVEILQKTAQFATTRLDRAWAAPAGAQIALERDLGHEREQKIGLINETTLDGDNFIWMRARVPDGFQPGLFRLSDFLGRVGAVPPPFTEVSDADLRSENDSLGTYFFLTYRTGGETNCVLAFRRINGATRQMPPGTNVLEVMLRNCVRGTIEQALAPITDRQIGVASTIATSPMSGGNRMLSPLAAPPVQ